MILDHASCPIGRTVRKLTRSEVKRQAVIDAARDVFVDKGYGDASMDDIAARANVSKRTVYNHFPGKDALFGAIIQNECDRALDAAHGRMDTDPDDIPGTLFNYAFDFLTMIYSERGVKLFRTVIAEAERFPELGDIFFQAGVCPAQVNLQDYVGAMMTQGRLRKADAQTATGQFFSLIKGDLHYRLLLCCQDHAGCGEIKQLVEEAVDVWMRAYAPG